MVAARQGGVLMLGGADSRYYTGDLHYVPLSRKAYWQFDLDSLSVGGSALVTKTSAIADTGTSLLVGPTADVNKLAAARGSDRGSQASATHLLDRLEIPAKKAAKVS